MLTTFEKEVIAHLRDLRQNLGLYQDLYTTAKHPVIDLLLEIRADIKEIKAAQSLASNQPKTADTPAIRTEIKT